MNAEAQDELLAVRDKWAEWRRRWFKELPGRDHRMQADKVSNELDEMAEAIADP